MRVTNDKRREVAAKVRETMGALGRVELDGIPLADLIEPTECDECSTPNRFEELTAEIHEAYENLADAMGRRLMPEGMEWLLEVWPKWSNGEYCKFGDWWKSDKYGVPEPKQFRKLSIYTPEQLREWEQDNGDDYGYEWDFVRPSDTGHRPDKVEAPAPAVLAADGEPLEVGQTVWTTRDHDEFTVVDPSSDEEGFLSIKCTGKDGKTYFVYPGDLTHQRPVLDADGVPIKKGDTVYGTVEGGPFIVTEVSDKGSVFVDAFPDMGMHGSMFTHTKPEPPDSRRAIVNEIGDEMAARIDLLVSSGRWSDAN